MTDETKLERVCQWCGKLKLDTFYYRRDELCCSKCNQELDMAEAEESGWIVTTKSSLPKT